MQIRKIRGHSVSGRKMTGDDDLDQPFVLFLPFNPLPIFRSANVFLPFFSSNFFFAGKGVTGLLHPAELPTDELGQRKPFIIHRKHQGRKGTKTFLPILTNRDDYCGGISKADEDDFLLFLGWWI